MTVAKLEAAIASLRRVARNFRANRQLGEALEVERHIEAREVDLANALEVEAQRRRIIAT